MDALELLKRLDEEATPGPWWWTDEYRSCNGSKAWAWSLCGDTHGYGVLSCDEPNAPQGIGGKTDLTNAELIATLRTLLPLMRAEIEAANRYISLLADLDCTGEMEIARAEYAAARAALDAAAKGEE